jgi:hypothetical protein
VKYSFDLKVTVHPRQDQDDPNPSIQIKVIDWCGTEEPALEVKAAGAGVIDTPDQARVDSDQGIPTPTPGPKGVLIDKLVKVPPSKK